MGLDSRAQDAIRTIRKTYTKGGHDPLKLAIAVSGNLSDLIKIKENYGIALRKITGNEPGSTRWRSMTPFVPPRYIKKRGHNSLEGQIIEELTGRGYPEPEEIRFLDTHDEIARKQRHFIRKRRSGPQPPQDAGFTLELIFPAPVRGPIALGYASHFGLGLFAAVDGAREILTETRKQYIK